MWELHEAVLNEVDMPVKPVCPKVRGPKYFPADVYPSKHRRTATSHLQQPKKVCIFTASQMNETTRSLH